MTRVLDYNIIVSELQVQFCFCIHFLLYCCKEEKHSEIELTIY